MQRLAFIGFIALLLSLPPFMTSGQETNPTETPSMTPSELPPPPTNTLIPTPTDSPTLTLTPTEIPSATATATLEASATLTLTATESPTVTATETATESPTATATETATASATVTVTETATASPTMIGNRGAAANPNNNLSSSSVNAQVSQACADTYPNRIAVVADDSQFMAAWNCAITYPADQGAFTIYLQAGGYTVNLSIPKTNPVISPHVVIYGRLHETVSSESIIYLINDNAIVVEEGHLELHNLIIDGGYNSSRSQRGGAITVLGASLTIMNSFLRNNGVHLDSSSIGGAIYARDAKNITIQRTNFHNNFASSSTNDRVNDRGGALHFDNSGNINLTCNYFVGNNATKGRTINFARTNQLTLINNDFYDHSFNQTYPSPTIIDGDQIVFIEGISAGSIIGSGNAVISYHPIATATMAPNISVNISETRQIAYTLQIPARETNPYCIPIRYSPPAIPTLGLSAYGVEAMGWSEADLAIILTGVQKITQAFSIHYNMPNTPETFRRVMINSDLFSKIQFNRAALEGPFPFCKNEHGVIVDAQTTITCDDDVILSEYTVVHELGHAFVNRTGGYEVDPMPETGEVIQTTFFSMISNPVIGLDTNNENTSFPLTDYAIAPKVIFGALTDSDNRLDWTRGNRGWGSRAIPLPNPSNFQQNPRNTPGIEDEEKDEAAADMFLNWVYFKINQGGFRNVTWIPSECYVDLAMLPVSCYQNENRPGDARYDWMNERMNRLRVILGF